MLDEQGGGHKESKMKIQNKADYKYFLKADMTSLFLGEQPTFKRLFFDPIWKFQKLLRKCEYYKNTGKKLRYYLVSMKRVRLAIKLGFTIPCNVFGPGLRIAHYGSVVVSSYSQIGANCTIHSCVNIGGVGEGGRDAPVIGDNVYIGPGAKLFGKIAIGNNTKIGANAVVNKSFFGGGTLVGVPAKAVNVKNASN